MKRFFGVCFFLIFSIGLISAQSVATLIANYNSAVSQYENALDRLISKVGNGRLADGDSDWAAVENLRNRADDAWERVRIQYNTLEGHGVGRNLSDNEQQQVSEITRRYGRVNDKYRDFLLRSRR